MYALVTYAHRRAARRAMRQSNATTPVICRTGISFRTRFRVEGSAAARGARRIGSCIICEKFHRSEVTLNELSPVGDKL